MFGKYFTYNGHSSSEYGLMIGYIDGMSVNVPLSLSRDSLYGTLNRWKNKVNSMGAVWQDCLTFEIGCILSFCDQEYDSETVITEDELDEINAWLTSPDYPLLFHMYDYDFEKEVGYDTLYITGTSSGSVTVTYVDEESGTTVSTTITVDLTALTATCSGHELGLIKKDSYYIITASNDEDAKWLNSITGVSIDGEDYIQQSKTSEWSSGTITGDISNSYLLGGKYEKFLSKQYDYFGIFTNVEPQLLGENIVGLTLTFSTNSPFAWSPLKQYSTTATESGTTLTLESKGSELEREIFPLISINEPTTESLGEKTCKIECVTDNSRSLEIITRPDDVIFVDCEQAIIYDSSGVISFEDLGIDDVGEIYWPRLYYGTNTINITGTATVTIMWREPRKVGAY